MALGTKPTAFVDGDALTGAQLNALITLLEIFGFTSISGGSGEGTIDNDNVKTAADIRKSKIADTAVVLTNAVNAGTQTITRPTSFSAGSLVEDTLTTNLATIVPANGAITLAKTSGKRYHFLNYSGAGASTIVTITGGSVGDIITIFGGAAGAGLLELGHTSANTVNTLKLACDATGVIGSHRIAAGTKGSLGTYVFGDLNSSGVNVWWEI